MYNYAVTAQKPTAVTHSVVGNFTSPTELNLIICKSTRLEIYLMAPEGLQLHYDFPLYGKVATMSLIRPPLSTDKQDFLFISTEHFKWFVLQCNKSKELVTVASGDVKEGSRREVEKGPTAVIDPEHRFVALHVYESQLKVIPCNVKPVASSPVTPGAAFFGEAFNARLEESVVIDVKCLHLDSRSKNATLAVLFEDSKEQRHLKTYEVDLKSKELTDGPWTYNNCEHGASMLIPVARPTGGVIIVGEQSITYTNGTNHKAIPMRHAVPRAFGAIDETRFLLGNHRGDLHVLLLEVDPSGRLHDLKLEFLGQTSIAQTLSYLDNFHLFIGSTYGDSQLVRVSPEKNEDGSYVQVLDSYTNLGPIVDMAVVDLERQGQCQVVTCSGVLQNGSLRIIRNGVGINEQATAELAGIKGLWSLRPSFDHPFDKYLVLSFTGETRVLAIEGEELEEGEIAGFQGEEGTVFAGNLANNLLLQVTPTTISLADADSLASVWRWSPPSGGIINVASASASQVVVALGGGRLVYFEVDGSALKEVSSVKLEHEIACVNVSPLATEDRTARADVVAVGMWTDISVRLLRLPNLAPIAAEPLGGEIIPRSVLLASFEGVPYLFCALGDGHLFTFVLDLAESTLREKKKMSLGTQPVVLNTFRSGGSTHVFAASDRPTVIYSSNKKLLFSNVNRKEVTHMCPFSSENFPESLALTSHDALTVGTIDDIQKLHIRTVPLGEQPRRISHMTLPNGLGTYAVLTMHFAFDRATGEESETHWMRLFDDQTFELRDSFQMLPSEMINAITVGRFAGDDTQYYSVGTAFTIDGESEPTKGRILVFRVTDEQKLLKAAEQAIRGAAYSLSVFNGKLLATVNSRVQLYGWSTSEAEGSSQLKLECEHLGHIVALQHATRGDFIAVADLMRSISLLLYKPADNRMDEIARDYNVNWMTAVDVLDDDTFLGAENSSNVFTVRRNADAATDEDRSRLDAVGQFHLGHFVNRFRRGSLVMKAPEGEGFNLDTILYGSVSGAIGVIATLSEEQFKFFDKVQTALLSIIKGIGGLQHKEWRSFRNERKLEAARNFLDGDLIESYLELSPELQLQAAKSSDVPVDELTKRIEQLQQAVH